MIRGQASEIRLTAFSSGAMLSTERGTALPTRAVLAGTVILMACACGMASNSAKLLGTGGTTLKGPIPPLSATEARPESKRLLAVTTVRDASFICMRLLYRQRENPAKYR